MCFIVHWTMHEALCVVWVRMFRKKHSFRSDFSIHARLPTAVRWNKGLGSRERGNGSRCRGARAKQERGSTCSMERQMEGREGDRAWARKHGRIGGTEGAGEGGAGSKASTARPRDQYSLLLPNPNRFSWISPNATDGGLTSSTAHGSSPMGPSWPAQKRLMRWDSCLAIL